MNADNLKQVIYTALKPLLPERTIWANSNAPRPALPYATLQLTEISNTGMPTFEEVDSQGVVNIKEQSSAVLEVQYYGEDAFMKLRKLRDTLPATRFRYPLLREGVVPYGTPTVTDITQLLGGIETEERSMVRVSLRYRADIDDDVGLIESVDTTGSLLGSLPVDMVINKP